GRDIFYANASVAGPGDLVVQAGRNIFQGARGNFVSLGQLFGVDQSNISNGANISVLAGVGGGPDYAAFASLYLDPAHAANPALPTDGQPGKAIQTADALAEINDLYGWVKSQAGYTGTQAGALAFFNALPAAKRASYPSNPILFAWLKTQGYTGDQGDA